MSPKSLTRVRFEFMIFQHHFVWEQNCTEIARDPTLSKYFLPMECVGVTVKLRIVTERLVAKVAIFAALAAKAVTLLVGALLVVLQHVDFRPKLFTLKI